MAKKWLLVKWIEESSVGVMPAKCVHKEDQGQVAEFSTVRIKWRAKFFDAEVLKLSGKCVVAKS